MRGYINQGEKITEVKQVVPRNMNKIKVVDY